MSNHLQYGQITVTVKNGQRTESFEAWDMASDDDTLPKIVQALGGEEAFMALPVLELDAARGTGRTGYLDFVQPEDMTAPVMRGKDSAGRPFVAFRMQLTEDGETRVVVETIFRRYITGNVWTSGGESFICTGKMTDNDIAFIAQLRFARCGRRGSEWAKDESQVSKTLNDLENRGARHLVERHETRPGHEYITIKYETGELKLV